MADNEKEWSWGAFFLFWLLFFALPMMCNKTDEEIKWWYYPASIPIALVLWCAYVWFEEVFRWIFSRLIIPGAGIFLIFWLFIKNLSPWMINAGIAYIIFGFTCANIAKRDASPAWAYNSLCALVLGFIMIVTGLIKHFELIKKVF